MERETETLKEFVVELLSDLIREREQKNLQPFSVTMTAIQNALVSDTRDVLNELCKEKVLTFHRTLNDISFEFTPPR